MWSTTWPDLRPSGEPITGYGFLSVLNGHHAAAHLPMEPVLQFVLLAGFREWLRPQVLDVV